MHYTLYVEGRGTTGGSSGGSSGGSTSGGSSGGKTGGSGGKTGGSSSSSSSSSSGSKSGGSGTSGSTGGNVKSTTPTIKKPKDLKKLPPVTVHQPDGTALVMNMQDFCYMPNANVVNGVAFQQCLARKKHKDDLDLEWYWIVILVAFFLVICVTLWRFLTSD